MADAQSHRASHPTDRLVGMAPALNALRAHIRHLASFDTLGSPHVPTVLLQGETGTGKSLVARVIHDSGPRAQGPFIEVNCAAIPETMLEAELFGFEAGAFTDAKRAKAGLFEAAVGGTLFLDEIDALPLSLQGKLLTAIETKRVRRLGTVSDRAVDVKLIATTNAVLSELMATGQLRVDLYHRLAVVVLALPPLRVRGGDIPHLARHLLLQYTAAHGVPPKRLSAEAEAWLQGYAWPGNVRELSHVMERVTLLHTGETVDAAVLQQLCQPMLSPAIMARTVPASPEVGAARALPTDAEEIRRALVQTGGNVSQAARLLGVSRDTVRYRMQRYGIGRPHLGAPPALTSPQMPESGTGTSPQRDVLSLSLPLPPTPPLMQEDGHRPMASAAEPNGRPNEVARLVDGWVALEARPLRLQVGDPRRAEGYAVVGVSPWRSREGPRAALARTPFVGRARELEILDALLDHVKAGRGQVVSVVAAPGMGKSRLLDTFCQGLSGTGVRYVGGQCLAYGSGVPYLPVLELLRDLCGIIVNERPETVRTKVRASLQQLQLDPDATLPYVLDLLDRPDDADLLASLSAETRKARTFEIVRQVFLTSSQQRPLVLAVEDLHWIDPTSEALLASLVDGLAGAPLLLLGTCRPGYRPPWLDKSYASHIALQPLRPDDSQQVLRHVVRGAALTPTLEQQLLAKAEGNPFFLEELACTALEHGEGHPILAVPDSIQAVLAARMERLPIAERQLLQTAAVFGKDFPVPVLRAVTELPEVALQPRLANLQAAEFLYESQFFPERAYAFKHALTQEVAYGSLLQAQRRTLHARFVEILETLYPDRLTQQVERLAHHALQGELWDKALVFCRQAGAKALAHSAYHEAAEFFEQALNVLRHFPVCPETQAQAIDLRLNLRGALWPLGELSRISVALQEAECLAGALGDQHRLGWVSAALLAHFVQACEPDRAIAAGRRALAIATALGDVGLGVVAQHFLGHVYRSVGSYHRAAEFFQNIVVTLPDDLHHEDFGLAGHASVLSRVHLSHCLAEQGAFTEGMARAYEGVRIAEAANHPYSRVLAYWAVGAQYLYKGDLGQAIPTFEHAADLAKVAHIYLAVPWVAAFLGAAYALAGRMTDALPLLEQAVEQAIAMRLMLDHACRVVWLGEAYLLAGRLEESATQAYRALEFSRSHQERGHEAYALRLLGDIVARCEPPEAEQAEAHYQQALVLAEELGMLPLLAHCHLGLGMLYRQQSRLSETHAVLSTAVDLYRTMGMTLWLRQAEAAMAQMGVGQR